jgi:ribosomal protein S18 acetylase RimI-like enzyme
VLEVRLLQPNDQDILSQVAEGVFDDPIVPSSAREFLNDPRHRLVAAIEDGTIVGFVSSVVYIHPDKPAPELWINEVGVAPTHQNQGIGKRLMKKTLEVAREAGCTEAWVLTERDNNAAMALYKSVGGIEEKPDATMFTFELL